MGLKISAIKNRITFKTNQITKNFGRVLRLEQRGLNIHMLYSAYHPKVSKGKTTISNLANSLWVMNKTRVSSLPLKLASQQGLANLKLLLGVPTLYFSINGALNSYALTGSYLYSGMGALLSPLFVYGLTRLGTYGLGNFKNWVKERKERVEFVEVPWGEEKVAEELEIDKTLLLNLINDLSYKILEAEVAITKASKVLDEITDPKISIDDLAEVKAAQKTMGKFKVAANKLSGYKDILEANFAKERKDISEKITELENNEQNLKNKIAERKKELQARKVEEKVSIEPVEKVEEEKVEIKFVGEIPIIPIDKTKAKKALNSAKFKVSRAEGTVNFFIEKSLNEAKNTDEIEEIKPLVEKDLIDAQEAIEDAVRLGVDMTDTNKLQEKVKSLRGLLEEAIKEKEEKLVAARKREIMDEAFSKINQNKNLIQDKINGLTAVSTQAEVDRIALEIGKHLQAIESIIIGTEKKEVDTTTLKKELENLKEKVGGEIVQRRKELPEAREAFKEGGLNLAYAKKVLGKLGSVTDEQGLQNAVNNVEKAIQKAEEKVKKAKGFGIDTSNLEDEITNMKTTIANIAKEKKAEFESKKLVNDELTKVLNMEEEEGAKYIFYESKLEGRQNIMKEVVETLKSLGKTEILDWLEILQEQET